MKGKVLFILLLSASCLYGQERSNMRTADSLKRFNALNQLDEVIVTGQFEAQSARNSVYSIRTIGSEQIRLRGATSLMQILNTEPGVRFSNDLALGTSDISLMGISGKGVKILLDGVPMLDRGEIRESLGQIDVHTIDRIEIVEGPMSVSYGTDALGGVINIITKKSQASDVFSLSAKVQEESAGDEYSGFGNKGSHNQHVSAAYNRNRWSFTGTFSQNDFGGWKGQAADRELEWNPKKQLLGGGSVGYRHGGLNIWYRLNATDETISLLGRANPNNNLATDKDYISRRFFHQAQLDWKLGSALSFNGAASYTDYSRRTKTTSLNVLNGDRRLSLEPDAQAKSLFDHTFFRGTMQYRLSDKVSLQPGAEVNLNGSSGDRIQGSPEINDYALFVSSELKLWKGINIRPGIRMLRNSVYDAPPVIPSLNTHIMLGKKLDMRLSYARGFRAPSLRELYFEFFDASHSITGNADLKAEYSHSYNGSLTWHNESKGNTAVGVTLSSFYNVFSNLIEIGINADKPDASSYINIGRSKTTGGSVQGNARWRSLRGMLGFSYIGRYNRISEDEEFGGPLPQFTWSPEVNSNIIYTLPNAGASINLSYKFNGRLPAYYISEQDGERTLVGGRTSSYNLADLSIHKEIRKMTTLSFGVKNLLNVTRVSNTAIDSGSAHNSTGPSPVSYGRSFFLGLTFQWSKDLSNNK